MFSMECIAAQVDAAVRAALPADRLLSTSTVVVIGGLLAGTFLTLLVVPALIQVLVHSLGLGVRRADGLPDHTRLKIDLPTAHARASCTSGIVLVFNHSQTGKIPVPSETPCVRGAAQPTPRTRHWRSPGNQPPRGDHRCLSGRAVSGPERPAAGQRSRRCKRLQQWPSTGG